MTKVKITKVFQTDRKKDGTELTNKFGKYWKVSIKTQEHGEKWLSGFFKNKVDWQDGKEIDIEIEPNGEYLNFKLAKTNVTSKEDFEALKERVKLLEEKFAELVLEVTGKIQLSSDYSRYTSKHPMQQGEVDEPPF